MADTKPSPQKSVKSKRKKIIVIICVVLLIVAAFGVGVLLRWWQTNEATNGDQPNEIAALPEVVDDLQSLRNTEDGSFNEKLQDALNNPDYDNDTRAMLYIQQGSDALDRQDYNAALEAYGNAERLVETAETAQLLGATYEEMGNAEKAVEYYQLTIDRWPENDPSRDAEVRYYNLKIDELS